MKKYADYKIPRPELFLDEDDDVALEGTNLNELHDNAGVSLYLLLIFNTFIYSKLFVKTLRR